MTISLITSAKDKEYREKLNVRNMEYLKKKGRTGIASSKFLDLIFFH